MTEREMERLAQLVAEALLRARQHGAPQHGAPSSGPRAGGADGRWLPTPVRPEPPTRGGDPPVWSGAGQSLDDIAPGAAGARAPRSRASTAELTRAARAAAAGQAPPRAPARTGRVSWDGKGRRGGQGAIEIAIGVSNRHIHLSPADAQTLFGALPTVGRTISQPGQFAAAETVDVVGPKGRIETVRVVGPARGDTQVELSLTDCRRLGIEVPVAASGALSESKGDVTLVGRAGSVKLSRGVIVAARHLHLAPDDAARWGIADGDRLDIRCGTGARAATLHGVLVRSGPTHATELHLDADEANACGVRSGDRATIVGRQSGKAARRALVTERDVLAIARAGGRLPPNAILTPSARDRARSLGLDGA